MILILVALKAEANPIRARLTDREALVDLSLNGYRGRLAGVPVSLITTGMGMRKARVASGKAMDALAGIDLVLTTGVAGGLRRDLTVGQVVLAERLLICRDDSFQPEHIIEPEAQRVRRLASAFDASQGPSVIGSMITARRPIMTGTDKQRAFDESGGAIAVDMESAAIALEAQRRGLPFICMRTILDLADEDVVGAGLMDQEGHVRTIAAAKALITNPRMIVGVAHLVKNLRTATNSLATALEAAIKSVAVAN